MENQLKIIKRSYFSGNIIISNKVEIKIRYICEKIHDVEWSGILFYTYEGSFDKKNLKIICNDIYIMDKGNGATTSFTMNPEVISYMTDNPELLECQVGLIH